MACSFPRWLIPLLVACAPACGDDGEPPDGDSAADTGHGDDSVGDGVTITTTQSTSITTDAGDDAGEASEGGGTAGGESTAASEATADGASSDDGADAGDATASDSESAGDSEDPSTSGDAGTDSSTTSASGEPVGGDCQEDADCESGVCWDFSDYDALCFGTVCSALCESDADCVAAASEVDAPHARGAVCGADGRCDLVGAGLGAFACA